MDKTVVDKTRIQYRLAGDLQQFLSARSTVTLAVGAFLLTVAVMFFYRPFSQAESGDSALYDYLAQSIVRGQLPFRDVVEIKAPASFYLSALAMRVGDAVGLRDVIAARLLHIALAGLLAAFVYLTGEAYLRDRFAALISVLVLLTPSHFAAWTVGGGQPKLPMIVFGTLTLLLIARDKPFWCGVCSMLSCLCWQPGLLFTGTALLVCSGYFTRWRDLRAAKVFLGAAIPLLALLLYFYSKGALGELWTWTVSFNYGVNAHKTLRTIAESFTHLWAVSFKVFKADLILIGVSLAGVAAFVIERARRRSGAAESVRDAIVIAPLAYLVFCFVRFSAAPYLLPLFPFIALFAGRLLAGLAALVDKTNRFRFLWWFQGAAIIVLVGVIFGRAIVYQFEPGLTLREQDQSFEVISRALGPDDRIYVHGTIEILALLRRPNLNPYVFLDWGKDDYVAARRVGGFGGIVDEMESQSPKVVALSRLQKVAHRTELINWVEGHYEHLDVPGYDGVYLRNSQPRPGVHSETASAR